MNRTPRHSPECRGVPSCTIPMPLVWIVVLVSVVMGAGCRSDPAPAGSLADLETTARRFYVGMAADDADENRHAMQAVVPTADDFAALFPRRHDELWKVWAPEVDALVTHAPEHAPSYREVLPIGSIRTVDLRVEGTDALKRGLVHLPPAVPARGVSIAVAKGERAAAAFVLVHGRWVWIWDLERLATLLGESAGG